MSNDVEVIVRPSQTLDYAPAKVYHNPGQVGVPNVHVMIGRGGSGKVLNGSFSATVTVYCTKYVTERKSPFLGRAGQSHSQFVGKFGQGVIGQPMGQQ